jgi:hypothetical protein
MQGVAYASRHRHATGEIFFVVYHVGREFGAGSLLSVHVSFMAGSFRFVVMILGRIVAGNGQKKD